MRAAGECNDCDCIQSKTLVSPPVSGAIVPPEGQGGASMGPRVWTRINDRPLNTKSRRAEWERRAQNASKLKHPKMANAPWDPQPWRCQVACGLLRLLFLENRRGGRGGGFGQQLRKSAPEPLLTQHAMDHIHASSDMQLAERRLQRSPRFNSFAVLSGVWRRANRVNKGRLRKGV